MKLEPIKILDLLGIEFISHGQRLALRCPFHDDKTPSGAFYLESGLFRCFAEELSLDTLGFYARVKEITREQAERLLQERYGWLPEPPVVRDELMVQTHLARLEEQLKAARPRLMRVNFATFGELLDKLAWGHQVGQLSDERFKSACTFLSSQFAKI